MVSPFKDFFSSNLIKICLDNKFNNLNCILGTTEIVLSFVFLIFITFGLIKLLNYYDKINYETSLLLFSIIQIILLDIIIIIPHDFLFELFFFVQIFHISLTIRKFMKIIKEDKSNCKENLVYIILNIINIIIFTLYMLSLLDIFLNNIYLYIQSSIRIYYFITAIILALLCRTLIKKLKLSEKVNESYELNLKSKESKESHNSNLVVSFHNSDWIFFLIRERQIIPLYILNLICSFIQMAFILSKHSLLKDYFSNENNNKYKYIELNNTGFIIYYFYIFICFLNVLVNYFCFYWVVRDQYNNNLNEINEMANKKRKKGKKRNVLDEKFIERETIKNKEEENEIKILMDDKKKYMKSLYSNTFTEYADDNDKNKDDQEKFFVQEKGEENDKKLMELTEEITSGRGTLASNNPINQSTVNNNTIFENIDKFENI